MTESSSWLSLGREAPILSPSILVVEGDMPSTSPGKGPSRSPEVPTTDLIVYDVGKLGSYLVIAHECLEHVQEMPSRKFNNEQCGYLVGKLIVTLQRANLFLRDQSEVKRCTVDAMTRCIEVFKLLLALALKLESFVQGCCKDEWLQAAMTLTNTAEYVSSLGFNLELCEVYFSMGWTATKALTAAQVDNIERKEVEIVKRLACLDVDVLLDKVISEFPSLRGEDKDLASYLLQRLRRVKPAPTSHSPESTFWSTFDDWGFLGQLFQKLRSTQVLGKGTSATVHKAVWLGTPVAKKTFYGPEHPDYVREAQILAGLCHPNIMSMFCCAMDRRKCSIVMELMDEDLHSFMQRRLDANPHSPPFSVFEAVDVILQIGEGVHYLHQNGIVHRDLKSFNILVKNILPPDLEVQYVLIKVADFGFAKIKESSTRYSNQTLNIGTNRWMPPEVMNPRNDDGQTSPSVPPVGPKYPKKSDVYSFGMVCYEILTGDLPFPHEPSLVNIKKRVLKGERPLLPDYCPSILRDLIESCWASEPSHRPCFASICSALKHLKCLLMSGFNSNEDSHIVICDLLPMSLGITPFETPRREIVVRRSPDIGELLPMSPEITAVEDFLANFCEPLPMAPEITSFGARTTAILGEPSFDAELKEIYAPMAAASFAATVNSSSQSVNGDDTVEALRSWIIPRRFTNTAPSSALDPLQWPTPSGLNFEFDSKEDPAVVSLTVLKRKISDLEGSEGHSDEDPLSYCSVDRFWKCMVDGLLL